MSSSYIGRSVDAINNISSLDVLTFNGSDATFNLTQNGVAFTPVSADALQIQIDGIIQSGNFSVSSSTVTFDFTPNSGSVCNSIKHFGVGLLTTVSDGAVTEAKIGTGAVTSSKIASGVIPTSRPNANPLIINGNMAVNQRGTSTGITTPGYYACDRFQTAIGNLATWTISQDSDVPSGYGFANSLKLDCTTADASPSTGEVVIVRQKFEGQDVQLLKKGTSNAEKVTVAFWIKATKTGTNILELFDRDNSRTISQSYTISSSNTWEYKVINFSADTTGVLDDDNNLSFEIAWWLASGTDYTSGTLQTSWGSQTDANRAVGQVNHGDSTSNNVYITGVQLEVGEYTSATLPPFQHESFADNLDRCQRYYQKSYKYDQYEGQSTGTNAVTSSGAKGGITSSWIVDKFNLLKTMRSTPTITIYDSNGTSNKVTRDNFGTGNSTNQTVEVSSVNTESVLRIASSGTFSATNIIYSIAVSSEL
jgi:hypothetical protein